MIKLSDDKELVDEINQKLKENYKKYGAAYCPCVPHYKYVTDDASDYICMCKQFREMEEGECHCGKFIKTKD